MSSTKVQLVTPLVEHLMKQSAPSSYRAAVVAAGVMGHTQAIGLGDEAIQAAYRTLIFMQWMQCSEEEVLAAYQQHSLSWNIDMPEDLQQGAVCY